ncbi:MAG: phage antirepressor KilAC domain-containing protein [Pantoea vagans]|jgi:phage antirepressor YoqD-like protein|nr:phage antirepressor KilAC domain-containing protein [Pantoea vagans]
MLNQISGGLVPSRPFNAIPGITSIEIAELVSSRHSDVKRSIERLADRDVIRRPPMAFVERINNLGHSVKVETYNFEGEDGKRDSIVVVAQLSPEFTARLVDRWQELEKGQPAKIPQTFAEALRLAAEMEEEKERLQIQLTEAAPKVAFVDRYVTATGSMTFRQVAKLLEAKEPELRLFLIESRVMYRLNGVLTPYSQHIEAGRFEVRTGTTNESNYMFSQSRFTAKGVQWIGGLWTAYKAAGGAE